MKDTNYDIIRKELNNPEKLNLDEHILANFQRILNMGLIPLQSCQGHGEQDIAYLMFVSTERETARLFDTVSALQPLIEDYLPRVELSYFDYENDMMVITVPSVSVYWYPCGAYKEALEDALGALEKVFTPTLQRRNLVSEHAPNLLSLLDEEADNDHEVVMIDGRLRWKENPSVRAAIKADGIEKAYALYQLQSQLSEKDFKRWFYRNAGYSLSAYATLIS